MWGRRGRECQRAIWGKGEEVTGDWGKFHTEELYDLCSSPNGMTVIVLRDMSWANHVARVGKRELGAGCP